MNPYAPDGSKYLLLVDQISCQEKEDYGLGEYVTIHITPEPQFSYVSFESNIPAASYLAVVTNILNTFNPGKFILTIFATKVCRRIFLCTFVVVYWGG